MTEAHAARVLIVDDEPDLRNLLTFNLESAGFAVSAVGNGRDGLSATHDTKPDVVILDIMLPDIM
ncbi:MAG: response regulator transcription factor, partial [Polyangiaceae bacterium]